MILIAHRGNFNGPNPEKENHPDYIKSALSQNYDVEVDVWVVDDKYVLGHDAPNYEVEFDFINRNRNLWLHAKNLEALEKMCTEPHLHYFWHQKDDFVATSKGYIWTYPGNRLGPHSICVMPEFFGQLELKGCAGVCSDFVKKCRGARNSGSVLRSND